MNCCTSLRSAVLEQAGPYTVPTILCIDDDPQVGEVIDDFLDAYEVRLLRAFHGMHGLWEAVTHKPDVIVTDLRMPQGDGVTVIESLKRNRQTAAIPIIVLTGRTEPGLQRRLKQIGAASYLTKPIHFNDLLQELQSYVEIRPKTAEDE